MIELKKDYTYKGVTYHQLLKNDKLVIYRCQRFQGEKLMETYYEIFRPKVEQPNKFMDDEWERYPSNENFGVWAWCCYTKGSALKVLDKHFNDNGSPLTNKELVELIL